MWGRQAEYAWAMPSTPAGDNLGQLSASAPGPPCCRQSTFSPSVALKQKLLKGRAKVVVKSLTVNQRGLGLGPSLLLLPVGWGELSEPFRVGKGQTRSLTER